MSVARKLIQSVEFYVIHWWDGKNFTFSSKTSILPHIFALLLIGDKFSTDYGPAHQIWSSEVVRRDNCIAIRRIIPHNFSHWHKVLFHIVSISGKLLVNYIYIQGERWLILHLEQVKWSDHLVPATVHCNLEFPWDSFIYLIYQEFSPRRFSSFSLLPLEMKI